MALDSPNGTPVLDGHAMAERLARMIQLPTVSAELAERGSDPFEDFISLLRDLYPLTHGHLEQERIGELGLLLRWRSTAPEADPVVLMAHFDVVPADEAAWTHPPFSGHIEEGWVHGRGALDDKGPLLVILEAVETLLAEDFTPERDVFLSFGGDEEIYGSAAAGIAQSFQDRGVTPWLVLDEGGAVVEAPLPMVSGQTAMIGLGEKGLASIRLSCSADAGHASAPDGLTAVARIGRAVGRLTPSTFPPKAPEAVTRMLQVLSERATGPGQRALKLLGSSSFLTGQALPRVGPEAAALVRTTVAATRIEGGTADNVLPSSASAVLNLRLIPGDTTEGAVERARNRIDDALIDLELISGSDPSPQSPAEGPQFHALAEAVRASYPEALPAPYLMMQASDARHFHRFAPAVYRFAPLEMSAEQRRSIHGVDERVHTDSLVRGTLFHRQLIRNLL
ncbi:M20/M25/M40 family metallo-hydrolase [Nesterenkonia muleiensis]|uniref:M20/M25/M40 family metallo-hydrolase n=1 Tax=Nesterenkonia muleiensis TaxID=2282648 RepID=UPI001EE3FE30|nr:M20/M25/M40 family metallo-hydrolase [Nesterenkonia muleiensis]